MGRDYEEIKKDLNKLNADRILRLVKLVEDRTPKKWGVFFKTDEDLSTPIDNAIFESKTVALYYMNIIQHEYGEFELVLKEVRS